MCNNFPNIRITEGNNFSIILPLLSRTYVATRPIDEEIDPEQLQNVVVTFGGVQYTAQRTERGVQIDLPATLAVGTYNILLTAEYLGSNIRAAYESAVTIVPWSEQSTAEQYIAGSPIVLRAAYVLGAPLTDAELEALKEEYREKNAQLQQAIADAEAAKAEWEQKAADLDGVAKESTSQQILQEVENIDIDTSDLAKEATLGTPAAGQPSTIFAAIAAVGGGSDDAKQTIVDAINQMGGSATTDMTWAQLSDALLNIPAILLNHSEFAEGHGTTDVDLGEIWSNSDYSTKPDIFKKIYTDKSFDLTNNAFRQLQNLKEYYAPNARTAPLGNGFYSSKIERVDLRSATNSPAFLFQECQYIIVANILSLSNIGNGCFQLATNLIDLIIGAGFVSNVSFSNAGYNPTNAYRTDISSLCFDTDLQEYGQLFSSNFDKWKWCIINHFAANLQDRTGLSAYTITFGSTVLSHFDAEMIAAFTDKNWNLA